MNLHSAWMLPQEEAAAGPIRTVALRPGRLEVVRLVVGYSECQKFIPIGAIRNSPCPLLSKGELIKA